MTSLWVWFNSDECSRQKSDNCLSGDFQHGVQAEPAQEHRGETDPSLLKYLIACPLLNLPLVLYTQARVPSLCVCIYHKSRNFLLLKCFYNPNRMKFACMTHCTLMHACTCMYVRVCVYVCVCVYLLCTCMHLLLGFCVSIYISICVCVCLSVCLLFRIAVRCCTKRSMSRNS